MYQLITSSVEINIFIKEIGFDNLIMETQNTVPFFFKNCKYIFQLGKIEVCSIVTIKKPPAKESERCSGLLSNVVT